MKSHDLAKQLLELPNDELFYEKQEFDGVTHKVTAVNLTGNITKTPAGLFIDGESDLYALSPQDLPVLGQYQIYFKEDITSAGGEERYMKKHISHLSKGTGVVGGFNDSYTLFTMYPDQDITFITHDDYYNYPKQRENTKELTVDDIVTISVLVSFDPETWKPTYRHMTYPEAIEFSKKFDGVNVFSLNLEETLEFMKTL